jgi:putative transposase
LTLLFQGLTAQWMARPTRLDIEGGWYHVVNRGIEKRVIFRGVAEYEHFIELLAKLPQRFGLRVHGYVLMPNHYHLQVETPRANLSRAMQWLNVSYSIWYNRKYRRVGPLFQGRFKAVLHDWSSHGLVINKYIHLNPVRVGRLGGHEGRGDPDKPPGRKLRAARVDALRAHRWSSYPYYSGRQKAPGWMTTGTILEQADQRGEGRHAAIYRRELEEAAAVGLWETDWKSDVKAMLLLGSGKFVERMKRLLRGDRREQTGLRKASQGSLSWEEVTAAVSKLWGEDWETLRTGYGRGALSAALYLEHNYSDKSLRELGELAGGMQYPAVAMAVRRFAKRLETDATLAKKIKRLREELLVKM